MTTNSHTTVLESPLFTPGAGFAVIDVETTGLSPRTSRIVEIAVVLLDVDCEPIGEMATLVNPNAHISATEIHGICARDVRHAPTFTDIATLLIAGLRGRVPVAHNAAFEMRMLTAEFNRMDVAFEGDVIPGLCTMSLAGSYLPHAPGRTLAACCAAASLDLKEAHTALGDARATAALLRHYRQCHEDIPPSWSDALHAAAQVRWPDTPEATARLLTRSQAAYEAAIEVPYLARLVAALPLATGVSALAQSYLAALDRALADRLVSADEAAQLAKLAHALSLGGAELLDLHRNYLRSVAAAAAADGVVTPAEMADLQEVAHLLALSEADLRQAVQDAQRGGAAAPVANSAGGLEAGAAVVITGETLIVSRGDLENRTRQAGLRLVSSVSRKTAVLVVADPHTQSGKARKARELGTRVVSEAVYLHMLAELEADQDEPEEVLAGPPAQRQPDDEPLATVTPMRPRA
jgi:DNA polymerase-3 subunit epsilon